MHWVCTDLLVGIISVSVDIAWRISVGFYLGLFACKLIKFLQVLVTYSSTYLLVSLSIDRLEAVVRPLSFARNRRHGRYLVGGAWLVSALMSTPTLVIYQIRIKHELPQCWATLDQYGWRVYFVYFAITTFAVPALIIASCYMCIVYTIWKKGGINTSSSSSSSKASSKAINARNLNSNRTSISSNCLCRWWYTLRYNHNNDSNNDNSLANIESNSNNISSNNNQNSSNHNNKALSKKQRFIGHKGLHDIDEADDSDDDDDEIGSKDSCTSTSQLELTVVNSSQQVNDNMVNSGAAGRRRSLLGGAMVQFTKRGSQVGEYLRRKSQDIQSHMLVGRNKQRASTKLSTIVAPDQIDSHSRDHNNSNNDNELSLRNLDNQQRTDITTLGCDESIAADRRSNKIDENDDDDDDGNLFDATANATANPNANANEQNHVIQQQTKENDNNNNNNNNAQVKQKKKKNHTRRNTLGSIQQANAMSYDNSHARTNKANAYRSTQQHYHRQPTSTTGAISGAFVVGEQRQHGSGVIPKARIKTIKMTLVIVFAFIVCWLPYILCSLLQVYGYLTKTEPTLIAISTFIQSLAHLNNAANPIIFWIFSGECDNIRRQKQQQQQRARSNNTAPADALHFTARWLSLLLCFLRQLLCRCCCCCCCCVDNNNRDSVTSNDHIISNNNNTSDKPVRRLMSNTISSTVTTRCTDITDPLATGTSYQDATERRHAANTNNRRLQHHFDAATSIAID
ncbi:Cardioacceleratory peptide receptor [Fragariocoptes setiger]|uniref:Cardioacceleratory peptide receptor n=1 Tax=Fragariocoptes setiger TaxID=1670756 RepID=A0ABQ7S5Z0_9ACAR|nr:Cardioacceleratory peptide receptor [Fragariocoptes setiger]